METDTGAWNQAVAWGEELAAGDGQPPRSWDHQAIAGLLAVAAYALALREDLAVEQLGVDRLIVPLFRESRFRELVEAELDRAGQHLGVRALASQDPVAVMWAWLTRSWPVDELRQPPPEDAAEYPPRYSIGGRCVPRPAVEVYLMWAASAADRALRAERGAWAPRTPVRVVGGEYAGRSGRLENPAWMLTEARDQVEPGPPSAYVVNLGPKLGTTPVEYLTPCIPAEHLTVAE